MGILKQAEPVFKTIQEVREFIEQKEAALQFWSSFRTINMSEMVGELKESISKAKLVLMEMEKCVGNL